MADLETCYFCGSVPDGALDEYAVVPPSLSPSPDHQRSVVLCPTCREKLTAVMEPVVEAAEAAAERADASPVDPEVPSTGEEPSPGDPEAAGEPTTGRSLDGRTSVDEPPADVAPASDDGAGADDGAEAEDDAEANDGAAADDGVTADDGATADDSVEADDGDADDGVAIPPAEDAADEAGVTMPTGADETDPTDDGDADDGATDGTDEVDGGGVDATDDDEDDGADGTVGGGDDGAVGAGADGTDATTGAGDGAGAGERREDPRDRQEELLGRNSEPYGKVLRLLRNREFPVERAEIEAVAASAYELEPQEVSDAVDAIVRKGLLVQEGAQLRRP